jgi:hypothetical protein
LGAPSVRNDPNLERIPIVGVAEYEEKTLLAEVLGVGQLAATTFGLPLEISETWYYTQSKKLPITVGVCEVKVGQVYDIADCTASLSFNPSVFTLMPGSVYTPTLQAFDIGGKSTVTPTDLTYSTPTSSISAPVTSVDSAPGSTFGQVTALALPSGTTSAQSSVTVTQQSTGVFASYTVNVVVTVVLTISPASPSIAAGSTLTLSVLATDGNGNPIATPSNLQWNSSNTAFATVSGGVVTGVAAGTATITVTDPVSKASAQVVVTVTASAGGGGGGVTQQYCDQEYVCCAGTNVCAFGSLSVEQCPSEIVYLARPPDCCADVVFGIAICYPNGSPQCGTSTPQATRSRVFDWVIHEPRPTPSWLLNPKRTTDAPVPGS